MIQLFQDQKAAVSALASLLLGLGLGLLLWHLQGGGVSGLLCLATSSWGLSPAFPCLLWFYSSWTQIKALQDVIFNLAPGNIFTAPFRRYQTHNSAGIESKVNYTDSFSPDPSILGLVILYRLLLVLPSQGTSFTKSTKNQQIIFRVGLFHCFNSVNPA